VRTDEERAARQRAFLVSSSAGIKLPAACGRRLPIDPTIIRSWKLHAALVETARYSNAAQAALRGATSGVSE